VIERLATAIIDVDVVDMVQDGDEKVSTQVIEVINQIDDEW
jgi:hypothetical protein